MGISIDGETLKMNGANALVMREMNVRLVRSTLRRLGTATRKTLSEQTGLTTVTVASCLLWLLEMGEVLPGDSVQSEGGRPSRQYRFNADYRHLLVLYAHEDAAGRDQLHVCVANRLGELIETETLPLQEVSLQTFEPIVAAFTTRHPQIGAIGFGLPGIEHEGRLVIMDYPALVGTRLSSHYAEAFRSPVIVRNDANTAALGYAIRTKSPSTAYLYFPTKYPPGAGFCLNGTLQTGTSGFVGEVAAIPFGIDWKDPNLYRDESRFVPAIGALCASVCAMWNPAQIVLQGSFLSPSHLQAIETSIGRWIPAFAQPVCHLSQDFRTDSLSGLVIETQQALEHSLGTL